MGWDWFQVEPHRPSFSPLRRRGAATSPQKGPSHLCPGRRMGGSSGSCLTWPLNFSEGLSPLTHLSTSFPALSVIGGRGRRRERRFNRHLFPNSVLIVRLDSFPFLSPNKLLFHSVFQHTCWELTLDIMYCIRCVRVCVCDLLAFQCASSFCEFFISEYSVTVLQHYFPN